MIALATVPPPDNTSVEPANAVLFHWGISPYCYKVRMAAAYKGVRFDERILGSAERRAAKAATGMPKVPVIQADDGWVTDSTDILRWLEERFPARSIYPADARARAECALLEDWADEALDGVAEPWIWLGEGRFPTVHGACVAEQPQWSGRATMRALRPVIGSVWKLRALKHGGVSAARALLVGQLALVEERLAGAPFLFGDTPTAADFAVVGPLLNLIRFRCGDVFSDAPHTERLVRHLGALLPDADWLDSDGSAR